MRSAFHCYFGCECDGVGIVGRGLSPTILPARSPATLLRGVARTHSPNNKTPSMLTHAAEWQTAMGY